MKRLFDSRMACLASLFVLLLLNALSVSSADTDRIPRQVVLGTATPCGGFQLFGRDLAEVINDRLGWIVVVDPGPAGATR